MRKFIFAKKAFILCTLFFTSLYGYAQSTVYLISSHDQTAPHMPISVNGGVDGMIEMVSPFHKATCMGNIKWYQKMIRKCTFNEEGPTILSYDVEFGSGKYNPQNETFRHSRTSRLFS